MTTVYDQIIGTWSDTTPQVQVIADAISFIDPRDVPLLDYLGGLDAARSKFKIGGDGIKIEILEDEYEPLAGTVNDTGTITTSTTLTNWIVTDASIFQDGTVILIDDEYMIVKAVDTSANTVTVYARDYGGTNATHASNAAITIVGMARLQGDDADYGGIVDITAPYNYTSIFHQALKVTGTQQVIDQYGIADTFSYQSGKALPQKLRLLNRMLYHGIRSAAVPAAAVPASAGGLATFITDNSVNAGGAISKADVDGLAEACYNDGGFPDVLVVNPAVANDLKGLIDTSSFVRVGQENSQLGMTSLKSIVTQYGQMNLLMDRHCPVAKAWMLDSKKVGVYTLRPFGWKPLAVTGDSLKGEMVGEFSFLVANDAAHGWIYGITS